MARRSGLLAEVLVSLALVMAAATGVLAIVLVSVHEESLRPLLAGALAAEGRSVESSVRPVVPGTRWWVVSPAGAPRARGAHEGRPDPVLLQLAVEAREAGTALLRPGGAGDPIRFAMPLDSVGRVAAARLPVPASDRLRTTPRRVAIAVLLVDALLFTAFGASLLRSRLILPLRQLRDAARAVAAGDVSARVPEAGARETADLAASFNTMNEALERRTGDLEKAVRELRGANRELREAREGLDRAERLAAVGQLAAGVAHEVGNPMGAILAFLDLAGRDPGLSEEARGHLERAGREGERVREILRQLLDFSRPSRGTPRPVDLAEAARETVALVGAQRRHAGIAFEIEAEPGTPPAHADAQAVTQILLNLLLNAADAVREAEAPRVTLRVAPAPLAVRAGDPPDAVRARRRLDGVACEVADNGPGVPEAERERIFDAFFTTKDPGEGTGLGLANAVRLAQENGGGLELLASVPGQGARFRLRLPAVAGDAGDPGSARSST